MNRILAAFAALAALAACETPALEVAGDRLFVAAEVNGAPVSALLDSAAEMSVADRTWAEQSGLSLIATEETAKGTGGEAEVAFAQGVSVETLGVTMPDMTIAVLDLSDIAARLVGRPVLFILGREIFDRERLAIDIEAGVIALAPETAPAGVALTLETERGIETIPVRVDGAEARAEFDLGNGSEVLIGRAFAERLGLLDDPQTLETRKGGGIGGELDRKIVRLKTLEIAGVTFEDVEAAVNETDSASDLNVGVRVLRNFRVTADFGAKTVWLDPR